MATADIGHTVRDVAGIMRMEDCGFVPVLDAQRIVGVVTDRDLVIRAVADGAADPAEMPIAEVMTSGDLVTIDPDESLSTAAHMMSLRQVRRLAVTRDGRLEGVLTLGDLEQATHGRGRDAREVMLSVTRPD